MNIVTYYQVYVDSEQQFPLSCKRLCLLYGFYIPKLRYLSAVSRDNIHSTFRNYKLQYVAIAMVTIHSLVLEPSGCLFHSFWDSATLVMTT